MKSLSRMERVPYLPLTPVNVSVTTTSPSGSLVHHLLAKDDTIKSSNESS